jgi:hypothetical protein
MMKYKFIFETTLSREVEIEAKDEDEAWDIAEGMSDDVCRDLSYDKDFCSGEYNLIDAKKPYGTHCLI